MRVVAFCQDKIHLSMVVGVLTGFLPLNLTYLSGILENISIKINENDYKGAFTYDVSRGAGSKC